jgi:hypothetical protein
MEEEQKRATSRFIAEEEDIEILGNKKPDIRQMMEADRILGKILKDKKGKDP